MSASRRVFLKSSMFTGSVWLLGCSEEDRVAGGPMAGAGGAGGGPMGADCDDPFAGAELLGTVPFLGTEVALETAFGVGWDGRLYTDLSTLDAEHLVTSNDAFYVRTLHPDLLDESVPWAIEVSGLVDGPQALTLDDLGPLVKAQGVHLMECSGNSKKGGFGLLSAADWAGASMVDVLSSLPVSAAATRVRIGGFDGHSVPSAGGHSTPGASWVFSLEQLAATGAFLATEMNGEPLPRDHGAPVRLLVPGWYGCTCIKWVNEIVLVDEAEPATSQMQEFASRTHQIGVPRLARDYLPASIDQAAMPVRVEKWRLEGSIVYRVVGVLWGGYEPTGALVIEYGDGVYSPVRVCPSPTTNATWTLWSTTWRPSVPGTYSVSLMIDDPGIVTRRLDSGYYTREITIAEV